MDSWKDFDYGKWEEEDANFDHSTYDRLLEETHLESRGSLEGWMKACEEKLGNKERPPWKPRAHYNKTGDIFEVYISNDAQNYYAKWLTPHVTLLLNQETDEIIGFQIWGVKHLINTTG